VRGIFDRHEFSGEKRDAFEAFAVQIERILNPGHDRRENSHPGGDSRAGNGISGRLSSAERDLGRVTRHRTRLIRYRTPDSKHLNAASNMNYTTLLRTETGYAFPRSDRWTGGRAYEPSSFGIGADCRLPQHGARSGRGAGVAQGVCDSFTTVAKDRSLEKQRRFNCDPGSEVAIASHESTSAIVRT
jgi:hypothetical protein